MRYQLKALSFHSLCREINVFPIASSNILVVEKKVSIMDIIRRFDHCSGLFSRCVTLDVLKIPIRVVNNFAASI